MVSLDALLSSLANDHLLVAKKITRLLIPSYFPLKVSSKEACNRFVALIRRSTAAAARFCEFALSEGASPKSLMELIRVCVDFILSPDNLNLDQIDGLFVAAVNICCILLTESSSRVALNELFSGEKLESLFTAAKTPSSRTSVLSIASMIHSDNASELLKHCMCLIMNCGGLSENVDRHSEVRAAHKLMLSCDKFNGLFEVLTNHLQEIASGFHDKFGLEMPKYHVSSVKRKKVKQYMKSNRSNGKRSMNSGMSSVEYELVVASGIAWQIKDLLVSVETRNAVLNSPMLDLVLSALKVIAQVNIEHCMHHESLDTSPVLAYAAVAMHKSLQSLELTDTNNYGNGNTNSSQSMRPSLEVSNNICLCVIFESLSKKKKNLFESFDFI